MHVLKQKKALLLLTIVIFHLSAVAQAGKPLYNVRDFGAKGDSVTLDSDAINRAIDAAAAKGGGTVYFPAGIYATYSIRLKSNICLYLDRGAVILGAKETADTGYDDPEPNTPYHSYQDFGHNHWKNSLIWGIGLHDITITGHGLIWGQGLFKQGKPLHGADKAIGLKECRNVNITDISILHGGHFALLATGVDNLTLDNLKVDTDRDGFDIDCCINVRISNCTVNSPSDDGICLKSSFALGYARATENVTISDCLVSGYDQGTLLDGTFRRTYRKHGLLNPIGRIKMGTESNGGFKNITITNCVFDYCRGLALETVDGGLLEDVAITNITMRDIVNAPIFIRLGARQRGPDTIPIGACRRIVISNIVAYNVDPANGVIISGIPGHDIEDLQLSNIKLYYRGGGSRDSINRVVPEFENAYPEPDHFGMMPSYGYFIRHVSNLRMNNIDISYLEDEPRPPFIMDHVKGADLYHISAQKAAGSPLFLLKNISDVRITGAKGITDAYIRTAAAKSL